MSRQKDYLDQLEAEAIYIMREVAGQFENPALLFSGGKDSFCLVHLALKAFRPGRLPFPLVHIDTGHNFPEVLSLRDSYVELDFSFVDAMLDLYLQTYSRVSGTTLEPVEFKSFFHLLTIQRKLKDAGRFEFINRVKGNPGFLPSIPASLRYVRDAFAQRPELKPLQDVIAKYVPQVA
ncbi:MAG: hypothetical protein EBZ36_15680 [Acidobacteria bacterium]|nr:hypothetical protein [Acidobacteriota bacterium]